MNAHKKCILKCKKYVFVHEEKNVCNLLIITFMPYKCNNTRIVNICSA